MEVSRQSLKTRIPIKRSSSVQIRCDADVNTTTAAKKQRQSYIVKSKPMFVDPRKEKSPAKDSTSNGGMEEQTAQDPNLLEIPSPENNAANRSHSPNGNHECTLAELPVELTPERDIPRVIQVIPKQNQNNAAQSPLPDVVGSRSPDDDMEFHDCESVPLSNGGYHAQDDDVMGSSQDASSVKVTFSVDANGNRTTSNSTLEEFLNNEQIVFEDVIENSDSGVGILKFNDDPRPSLAFTDQEIQMLESQRDMEAIIQKLHEERLENAELSDNDDLLSDKPFSLDAANKDIFMDVDADNLKVAEAEALVKTEPDIDVRMKNGEDHVDLRVRSPSPTVGCCMFKKKKKKDKEKKSKKSAEEME